MEIVLLQKSRSMKLVLFLFVLNFVFLITGQTLPLENTDSLYPTIQIDNTTSNRKSVLVQAKSTLEFVKFVPRCSATDSTIMCETRVNGFVVDLDEDTVHIAAQAYFNRQFNQFDQLFLEHKSIIGESYRYSFSLSEIDGVYYSSHWRTKIRNTSMTLLGVSLFTALVAAPLFSLEYKNYGIGTPGGFNRKQYFTIAGTGMVVAAASFSFYILMKPRYYSLASDDFNPKRQRWMLSRSK